jgi:hypothetical protein
MYPFFRRLGTIVVVAAGLAVSEASLAGPPDSPYGGVGKVTCAGSRERQRRVARYHACILRHRSPVQYRHGTSYRPTPARCYSDSSRIPDSLRNQSWGWWDFKDRW